MTDEEIAVAAESIRRLLAAIDGGELVAPGEWRWYLRGAAAALDAVQGLGELPLTPEDLTADERLQ